jgi:hypothetical protein
MPSYVDSTIHQPRNVKTLVRRCDQPGELKSNELRVAEASLRPAVEVGGVSEPVPEVAQRSALGSRLTSKLMRGWKRLRDAL